jgi:hypothetical protein
MAHARHTKHRGPGQALSRAELGPRDVGSGIDALRHAPRRTLRPVPYGRTESIV